MNSNKLICCGYGGIGDRVRLILFALKLAKKCQRELLVQWPLNAHLGSPFEKLFQSDAFKVIDESEFSGEAMIEFDQSSEVSIEKVVMGSTCDILKIRAFVDGFSYKDFDKYFRPTKEVARMWEWFWDKYRDNPRIGVNVRAGDKKEDMPSLDDYFAQVDKALIELPKASVLLVTDGGDGVIQEFIKVYKERLITYPMRSLDRNTENHCFDAVVTLYLLKRCHAIVTSNYSGFSRLAAGRSRLEMPGKISTIKL
jgi:hypothetical protein